jgi:hypothetical protein
MQQKNNTTTIFLKRNKDIFMRQRNNITTIFIENFQKTVKVPQSYLKYYKEFSNLFQALYAEINDRKHNTLSHCTYSTKVVYDESSLFILTIERNK